MRSPSAIHRTPLAGALVISGALLFAGTACNKKSADADDTQAAATATSTPAATASNTAPAASDNASTTGNASGAMGSDAAGTADTTASTAPDMGGMSMGGMSASGPVSDAQFYTHAMTGDQEEIATANLVSGKTSNADVKHLATKISSDHQAFDTKVKAAAGSSVASLPPAQPDSALEGKTGTDLDRAYADTMVTDHQKDIPMFENVAKNGSTAQARKLASEALPKLREHLKMAQDLQKKLGSG
ncbi:MAG: rane protein [Xanthomonadaceae bacterium]|nr:rane protein [Xanthomonadaceae bacterium]